MGLNAERRLGPSSRSQDDVGGDSKANRVYAPHTRLRQEGHASRTWTRWAELVVRHRLVAAVLGIAVLVTLAIPVFSITTAWGSKTQSHRLGRR